MTIAGHCGRRQRHALPRLSRPVPAPPAPGRRGLDRRRCRRARLRRRTPAARGPAPEPAAVQAGAKPDLEVRSGAAGAIQAIDRHGLLALAVQHDCLLVPPHAVGDIVPHGSVIVCRPSAPPSRPTPTCAGWSPSARSARSSRTGLRAADPRRHRHPRPLARRQRPHDGVSAAGPDRGSAAGDRRQRPARPRRAARRRRAAARAGRDAALGGPARARAHGDP